MANLMCVYTTVHVCALWKNTYDGHSLSNSALYTVIFTLTPYLELPLCSSTLLEAILSNSTQ